MVKEFIVKEISDTIDLKRDFSNKIKEGSLKSSEVKNLQTLVKEQEEKLSELQKIYDFIERAEQYQNLELFGRNYFENNPDMFNKPHIDVMESERQAMSINLHHSVADIMNFIADKAESAIALIDSDRDKAKDTLKTTVKYIRDIIAKVNENVIDVQKAINSPDSLPIERSFASHPPLFAEVNNEEAARLDLLTRREKDVLSSIAKGMSNKEIGTSLNISERTVKNHVSNVFKKIGVLDRTQAALFAIKNNFIQIF